MATAETKKATPELSFNFMFGRVRDFITSYIDLPEHPYPPTQAAMMLFEMEDTHGQESIISMYGFIRYSSLNYVAERDRIATVVHDLNGRRDKHMMPRTSDYYNFCNQ